MTQPDWNARYAGGDSPWDTGQPDSHLVEMLEAGVIAPCRVLEVGCGTGTNALWLAERGFDVLGIDIAKLAIERAEAKREAAHIDPAKARFALIDFLQDEVPGAPFDFVFDRGVLHVFDDADVRARFASRVADLLSPRGQWLSLAGSTEGPERDHGPPRRSARDLVSALEPALEIVFLRSTTFAADLPSTAMAWLLLSRRRDVPAQPSTRRE